MFTLWTLVEASLLCLNAVCILHEERFLVKSRFIIKKTNLIVIHKKTNFLFFIVGWSSGQSVQGFGEPPSVKSQMLNLIRSIRTVAKSKLH